MKKFWIVAIGLAVSCALVGCSKTFMCHLNGTSCPASPQAASGAGNESSGGGEGTEEPAQPETSSEENTSKPEEPTAAKAESHPGCKPGGATCEQNYQCCSEACVTHSPDNYCR